MNNNLNYVLKNTIEYFGDVIFSIEPVSKENRHLFDMSELSDEDIDKLIDINIEDKNLDELEEELGNLCGGIVIIKDEKVLLTPTCCGDLSDIYNWEEIKSNKTSKWTKLWIGHPWVYYKRENDLVLISEYYEDEHLESEEESIELKIRFEIPINKFDDLIKEMRIVQESFQNKLSKRLKHRGIENYDNIADNMACSYR